MQGKHFKGQLQERKCRITSEDFEDTTVDCNTHWQHCLRRALRLQKEKAAKDIEYDTGET